MKVLSSVGMVLALAALSGCSSSNDAISDDAAGDAGDDLTTGDGVVSDTAGDTTVGDTLGTDVTKPDTGPEACLGSKVLTSLGKSTLLVGASMSDASAAAAPWDLRYLYISGGFNDGTGPCTSCGACTAKSVSCANDAGTGCAWWGCWQWDAVAPGDYARAFVTKTGTAAPKQIPMFTYYEVLQASGLKEGTTEVAAANDLAFMTRYFADWRFLLQQIGTNVAFLHIEPDFWGYAEQVNENPHATPAKVKAANAKDCAGQEDSIAGMGRCMIAMVRIYAPNAKVGLHASAWGTKRDVLMNTDGSLDVAGEAKKLAKFLAECGASDGDYIVTEASDRDAGYYTSIGQNRWWDDTNTKLPTFHQAFAWATALTEALAVPNLWWQLPVGNMSLPNTSGKWRDNRVDYFFAHTDEVAKAHGIGFAFGSGMPGMSTPESDGGNVIAKTKAYSSAGGRALCGP